MTRLFRTAAASAAAVSVATVAAYTLAKDPPAPPPAPAAPAMPTSEIKFAVDPKPLSESVKNGLKYLASQQQEDGGWGQGGGWRTNLQGGGRVEGKTVEDPSDVGNTCYALLAFLRAGHSPTEGEYKEQVAKGLRFVLSRVEKSKADELYVTDVRNTQLQSKIGPFVDTFLTTLVLSELKGKGGDDDKRLVAALDKTVTKIAKHQKDDGTFAGNRGWAPVLSQGVANKALSRARQNGVAVRDEVLARAAKQSELSVKGGAAVGGGEALVAAAPVVAGKPGGDRRATQEAAGGLAAAGPGDAGVPLYRLSQGAGNLTDVLNSVKVDADKAKNVLKDANATAEQKAQAGKKVEEFAKLEKEAGDARKAVAAQARDQRFVAGFGNNGGEEFLSFLNISEMLVVKADKDWTEWDGKMQDMLPKAQDKDGSWSGHHCITGKTFCTAGALLVLMADRTPFPADVIKTAREKKDEPTKDEKK